MPLKLIHGPPNSGRAGLVRRRFADGARARPGPGRADRRRRLRLRARALPRRRRAGRRGDDLRRPLPPIATAAGAPARRRPLPRPAPALRRGRGRGAAAAPGTAAALGRPARLRRRLRAPARRAAGGRGRARRGRGERRDPGGLRLPQPTSPPSSPATRPRASAAAGSTPTGSPARRSPCSAPTPTPGPAARSSYMDSTTSPRTSSTWSRALAARTEVTIALPFEPGNAALAARARLLGQLRERLGVATRDAPRPTRPTPRAPCSSPRPAPSATPAPRPSPPEPGLTLLRSAGARGRGRGDRRRGLAARPRRRRPRRDRGRPARPRPPRPRDRRRAGGQRHRDRAGGRGAGRRDRCRRRRGGAAGGRVRDAAAPPTCCATCAAPASPRAGSTGSSARCAAAGSATRRRRWRCWRGRGRRARRATCVRLREAAAESPAALCAEVGGVAATMASRPLRSGEDGPALGRRRRPRAARRRGDRRGPRRPRRARAAGARAGAPRGHRRRPRLPRLERPGRGPGADRQPLPAARRPLRPRLRRLAAGRRVPAPRPRRRPVPLRSPARAARARPPPRQRSRGALPLRRLPGPAPPPPLPLLPRQRRERRRRVALAAARRGPRRCWRRRPTAAPPDPVEAAITRARDLADVVAPLAEAPSEDELARALAAHGAERRPAARCWPGGDRGRRCAAHPRGPPRRARRAEAASRAPGPLTNPAVLASLAAVAAYGGTTLEGFDVCSYRWFAEPRARPGAARPGPRPAGPGRPHPRGAGAPLPGAPRRRPPPPPDDARRLDRPRPRAAGRALAEREIGGHPAERAMVRRVERLLERFLGEEAGARHRRLRAVAAGGPLRRAARTRERPALDLGGWGLHGAIDRVDRGADGRAVVIDYKLSRRRHPARQVRGAGEAAAAALPARGRRALGGASRSAASTTRCAGPRTGAPRGVVAAEVGGRPGRLRPLRPRRRPRRGARGASRRPASAPARSSPASAPARSAATPARARACAATTSVPPCAPSPRSAAATAPPPVEQEESKRVGRSDERARPQRPTRERPRRAAHPDPRAGGGDRGPRPRRPARGRRRDRQDRGHGRPLLPPRLRPEGLPRRRPRLHLHRQGGGRAAAADPGRAGAPRRGRAPSGRAAALLATIGGAWITTIHGFCNRLLAAHPVAAGVDPGFRVLDAPEAERAAREAFDDALAEFLAGGEPAREETVAAYDVEGLRGVVADLHDELRSRGVADPTLPDPPAADPAAAIARDDRAAADCLEELKETDAKRELLERALARLTEPGPPPALDELRALRTGGTAKAAGRLPRGDRGGDLAQRRGRRGRRRLPPRRRACCELFAAGFEAAKERRAGIDFEDLQILAARLLERAEIGEAYRGRFSHLLVDEFQDTNRLQLRLIEALQGPKTQLVVVGDELQSIYSFRHADLDVFRRRREQIDADPGAELMRLSGNFRSRPEVVGAVNLFGEALLGARLPAAAGRRAAVVPGPARPRPGGRAAADRARRLGRGGDRARTGDRRPHPAQLPGRGAGPRRAPARARRRRGRARRDGRPAARLHPPRRLRGLAGARRPAPLRGRRARLLVPAAGGRRLRAAGDDRQPARRRSALRRPRLARLRGRPGHALAAARRGRAAAPRLAGAGARGGARRARDGRSSPRPERLADIPAGERGAAAPSSRPGSWDCGRARRASASPG